MIGVSTEFAIAVTNWIATIAHNVCRQLAAEPAAGEAGAVAACSGRRCFQRPCPALGHYPLSRLQPSVPRPPIRARPRAVLGIILPASCLDGGADGTARLRPLSLFPINDRPVLRWPNGARLAVWIIPNIEFFPLTSASPAASTIRARRCRRCAPGRSAITATGSASGASWMCCKSTASAPARR